MKISARYVIAIVLKGPLRLPSGEKMPNEGPNPLSVNYTKGVISKTSDGDKEPNTSI